MSDVKNNEDLEFYLYVKAVSHTLRSMMDLADEDDEYSFEADLIHYYENTIQKEGILNCLDFMFILEQIKKERKQSK